MHKFMRAIGFSDLRRKDIRILLDAIVDQPDMMAAATDSAGNELIEFVQEINPGIGVAVRGYYNEEDEFEAEYYVPYLKGSTLTTRALVDVAKHAEKESYAGLCEDVRVGLSIIFYVNEVAALLNDYGDLIDKTSLSGVYLSALSTKGTILLPVKRPEEDTRFAQKAMGKAYLNEDLEAELRDEMVQEPQIQQMKEMNLFTLINQRMKKEDILSIVATSFMPYGVESDQYGIIGVILDVREVENIITEEHLYVMKLDVNGLILDLCINKKDLEGIPAEGRRFKGEIWMQGIVGRKD